MYHWNLRGLAEDLRAQRLSSQARIGYLILFLVTYPTELIWLMSGWADSSSYWLVERLAAVALGVVGALICHRANEQGDGKAFIERFVCISWPVTVRLTVIATPIVVLLLWMVLPKLPDMSETQRALDGLYLFLVNTMQLAYYLWIRAELLRVSGARSTTNGGLPK